MRFSIRVAISVHILHVLGRLGMLHTIQYRYYAVHPVVYSTAYVCTVQVPAYYIAARKSTDPTTTHLFHGPANKGSPDDVSACLQLASTAEA